MKKKLLICFAMCCLLFSCGSKENIESEVNSMFVYINGNKLKVDLENNSSAEALTKILSEKDLVFNVDDYGGFEKVGDIGYDLPQNNTRITTEPGDVILYLGNNISFYYDTNTWTFTKIGKINGYSKNELCDLLGKDKGLLETRLSLK